jgi:hypothetical protein
MVRISRRSVVLLGFISLYSQSRGFVQTIFQESFGVETVKRRDHPPQGGPLDPLLALAPQLPQPLWRINVNQTELFALKIV